MIQVNNNVPNRLSGRGPATVYLKSKVHLGASVSYLFSLCFTDITLFFTYLYQ
jgi:hypothetical protein